MGRTGEREQCAFAYADQTRPELHHLAGGFEYDHTGEDPLADSEVEDESRHRCGPLQVAGLSSKTHWPGAPRPAQGVDTYGADPS